VTKGIVLAVLLQAAFAASASAAVPAWTTYRHDAARSGMDPDSTSLVAPSQLWQTPALDGEVYAQPLVYGPYVYVATENDTIYRLDAASGAVVSSTHLATPEPSSFAPCGDIDPSIGFTSTPVIDPSTNRIYAVGAASYGVGPGSVHHELFALDLSSGQRVAGFPIQVDPTFPSGGSAVNQLQRAGLALDSGRILIGYGGNDGDCNTYWGWLVSAPASESGGLSSFQVDPNYREGAIWAAGNAPTIDSAGNVFLATGNGKSTSSINPDYGDSVVKLNALASSPPLDWWAPANWQSLDSSDADLGSSMPTLLPGGYVFQSGKDGNGYLLNGAQLGNVAVPVEDVAGMCPGGSFGGSVYDPANLALYVACGQLRALSFTPGSPPSLSPKFTAPAGASGPPMIAGGLVWVTSTGGNLYGLDPTTGVTRSHFSIPENREPGGSNVNHFASPSAGGGRLFVGSGDQVTALTIAQPPPPTQTSVALTSSANPAAAGTAVSLAAAVTPVPDAGTMTFTVAGTPIADCSGLAVSPSTAGIAACRTAFAKDGTYTLRASYSGDSYYSSSVSAPLAQTITQAPIISSARIVPHRFTARHGAKLDLTLNKAATVKIAIAQLRHGHLHRGRCSTEKHTGRPCQVRVTLIWRHFAAGPGFNSFKLKTTGLASGRYMALVTATDSAGRTSTSVRTGFTILPAHNGLRATLLLRDVLAAVLTL